MKLAYHPAFIRMFKKLPKDLQTEALEKIHLFEKNPKNPQLKTHRLKGRLNGFQSFAVNYSYRIIFEMIQKEATLLEIGNHDIYK